jgi:hypothetical protein
MKWKDVTSYSRGEAGNTEPRAWQLDGPAFHVTLHRLRGASRGWFLSVPDLGIDRVSLGYHDLDRAQAAAVAFVVTRLDAWLLRSLLLPGHRGSPSLRRVRTRSRQGSM